MSIESEILRIQRNVADTYAAVADKGGTVPTQPTSANLAAAVASIPAGTGDTAYLVRAPVGTIVIWSGTADDIPTGWQLCDGTNGTPDLRDKFVLGAGTAHSVGSTGGHETVKLTVGQIPSHSHQYYMATGTDSPIGSGTKNGLLGGEPYETESTGGSLPHPNMPPYYALCYIMKLTADATDGVTQAELTEALEGKQDALTGEEGQVVGFDAQGNAVAQNAGEVYSTEETRIGTWIDGKPLYRKVYRKVVGNSALEEIANLSSLQIDFVSHIYGVFDQIEGEGTYPKAWEPANHMYPSENASSLWISNPNLLRCANPSRTSSRITAIIEYTKTTDPVPTKEVAE